LPALDCLPYARGKNIMEGMRLPAGAIPDSTVITFKYKKNGKEIEFDQNHFPDDLDSTYEFISRYDKVVRKGTALPPITDFSLTSMNGNDTTKAILTQSKYIMLFAKDFSTVKEWEQGFRQNLLLANKASIPVFLVTAMPADAQKIFGKDSVTILACDATVIKTAARVNATYLFMGPYGFIADKVSYAYESKMNFWMHSYTFNSKN
jgi:hypothetical protein